MPSCNRFIHSCIYLQLKCHAVDCHGSSEAECNKADDRAECNQLSAKANNVFCRWQHCKAQTGPAGPPPPPQPAKTGCTDPKALNYDPTAKVMADGSCMYKHVVPTHPPPPPTPRTKCTTQRYYYCHTKSECDAAKLQWVPCAETIKYGGRCYGLQQKNGGQCSRPCTKAQTHNCHTPEKCAAAGASWYQPPPYKPGVKPPAGRCERKCSAKSTYTCRTEAACRSVNMQWLDGAT